MGDDTPRLALDGIAVCADDGSVVEAFSLRVARGEAVVLHGPDDQVRGRLLRVAAGLEAPSTGRVALLGIDPATASAEKLTALRARMGVVFLKAGLLARLSLGENVAFPVRVHGDRSPLGSARVALERLDQVGLADWHERFPPDLPLGKVRLGALARALALDPEILFVEELSLGLDAAELELARATIEAERRARGLTVLAVSSFPSSPFAAPARVVTLQGGTPCTTSIA